MKTEKQTILSLEETLIKNPVCGAYVSLAMFLKGKNHIREDMIRRLFKRVVPKEDYERRDVDKLIEHLIKQTKYESV